MKEATSGLPTKGDLMRGKAYLLHTSLERLKLEVQGGRDGIRYRAKNRVWLKVWT